MTELEVIKRSADFIRSKIKTDTADIAIILGTGLGGFAKSIKGIEIPYSDIPDFPVPSVKSHEGKLIFSEIADKKVLCFVGRIHYYEGFPMSKVVMPVRIMKELGVKYLVITNSAGSLKKELKPGELIVLTDHINMMGTNPLIGKNISEHGPKFVDMSEPYDLALIKTLKQFSPIPLKEGVYVGVSGPSFETPSEVNFFRQIGGDVVGMSTVPECIVSNHCGIKTVGISCISNYTSGVTTQRLDHNKVIEIAQKAENDLISIILNFIGCL